MRALSGVFAVAMLVASCAPKPFSAAARLIVVPMGAARPATTLPVVFAEVSATPERRSRGLGGRDRIAPDGGMLFVYATEEMRNYWMKDCLVGLDIAFIGPDFRIANVVTLPPAAGRPESEISHAKSAVASRYVLETAAGWLAGHGIAAGDEVDLSAAIEGVVAR